MKKGVLVFIMGVSGAGKNTILHLLAQRNPQYKEVISCKTRPLRPGEVDGKDYHYMTNENFIKAIDQGVFLEYAQLHGGQYYYGTRKSDIVEGLSEGHVLLKEIDMQGIEKLAYHEHQMYEDTYRIFLDLSEETMVRRITNRAPTSDEELARRLHSAALERVSAKTYASVILPAEGTVEEVYALVLHHIKTFLQTKGLHL